MLRQNLQNNIGKKENIDHGKIISPSLFFPFEESARLRTKKIAVVSHSRVIIKITESVGYSFVRHFRKRVLGYQ